MTAEGFRRIALRMEGALESAHHGHPDFRVNGRIFATLGYPDRQWGMVNLTPEQQRNFAREHGGVFVAVKGVWGEQGATTVRLAAVNEDTLGEALTLAWQNTMSKGPARAAKKVPRKATSPRAASARARSRTTSRAVRKG
jgi:hypothetical protein